MMLPLKELAFAKFTTAALVWPILVPAPFALVVQEVYDNTAQGDRIRDVVLFATVRSLEGILGKEDGEFTQLMLDLPGFAVDIIKGVRFNDDFEDVSIGPSEIRPGDTPMRAYRCLACSINWSIDATNEEPICLRPDCMTMNEKMAEVLESGSSCFTEFSAGTAI